MPRCININLEDIAKELNLDWKQLDDLFFDEIYVVDQDKPMYKETRLAENLHYFTKKVILERLQEAINKKIDKK